jgi:PilZ domain
MTRLFGNLGGKQGQRGTARVALGVPGTLVMAHATLRCLIDDISASGAKIRCEAPLGAGTAAELRFEEWRGFASVAWARGGRAGLRFDRRLTLEDIESFRRIAANPQEWVQTSQSSAAREWSSGIGRLD